MKERSGGWSGTHRDRPTAGSSKEARGEGLETAWSVPKEARRNVNYNRILKIIADACGWLWSPALPPLLEGEQRGQYVDQMKRISYIPYMLRVENKARTVLMVGLQSLWECGAL